MIPSLLWLMERLAVRHHIHVFALYQYKTPSRYELLGTIVDNIGRPWTRFRSVTAVLAEHRRDPFDVLHAFWATPAGVLAVAAGRLIHRPVALHLGGGEVVALPEISYGGLRTLRGRLWVRLALRGAARITVASQPMLEHAAALGVRAQRMPLGVDLARWPRREPQPRFGNGPARLLHVGSQNSVKDQRTLLRAVKMLAEKGVEFHLDIVGEDTMSGELPSFARALGLRDCVTFHGFLPHPQVRPLFERAHALLVSSRHEAGPLVVLEAAIAGIPTVGTAVGHIREWAPEAAVSVPVGDYAALARETLALLADDERRLRLARAAQARAIREDADWTAHRVLEIYQQLVQVHRSRARA